MTRALEKRPVDADKVEKGDRTHPSQTHRLRRTRDPSRRIGEWVMDELKDLDPVAYVRFASVYRSFQDLNAFSETVQSLQSEPSADLKRKQLKLLPDVEGSDTGTHPGGKKTGRKS